MVSTLATDLLSELTRVERELDMHKALRVELVQETVDKGRPLGQAPRQAEHEPRRACRIERRRERP